ncbi:MAG: SurA N-terminal domain-containing protein [Candidatus Moduliflexus flocculans]|nr:SurA N-terminal domain-containing protein [Candidatus Moduliflexus flocculans]
MLKSMRRNVKSLKPILWLIVITFVAAIFTIWGGAGRLGEENRSDTLATIGGDRIASDEYYQALRVRLEAIQKQFGGELNANLIQQLGVPQQTLEQLVQQRLLVKIATDMGLRATDAEVRAKIVAYPAFQQDGQFVGFEDYKRVLDYNRIPLADFENGLRQDVVIGKVVRVLTAGHLRHRRGGLGRLPEAERHGQDRVPRRRDGQGRDRREAGRSRAPGPLRQERLGLQDPREEGRPITSS